jgi:hypothetical protein
MSPSSPNPATTKKKKPDTGGAPGREPGVAGRSRRAGPRARRHRPVKAHAGRADLQGMRLSDRAFRRLILSVWIVFAVWSFGAPLAAQALYRGADSKPHGVTRVLFYCHL